MDDLIPVAKLELEGEGNPLIIDISTVDGWVSVYEQMALNDGFVSIRDLVEGWVITLDVMSREEYENLPEHTGW